MQCLHWSDHAPDMVRQTVPILRRLQQTSQATLRMQRSRHLHNLWPVSFPHNAGVLTG